MKHRIILAIAATLALMLLMGWAGECDYTEQTILHMSQSDYDKARAALIETNNAEPTESQIAHWWTEHSRHKNEP